MGVFGTRKLMAISLPIYLVGMILFATGIGGCELVCGEDRPVYEADYGEGDGVDVGSLIYQTFALFQSLDIPSEIGPEVETGFFDRPAREIKVQGSPVFFLAYDTEEESREVATSIGEDGRSIDGKPIPPKGMMKGTPHYFRSGKVIAFYFGEREKTLDALRTVLGEEVVVGESVGGE